jgi:uroporphyrinogen decarboxylase
MTPREVFIDALNRRPISGRVPTYEMVFFLTMEKFNKVHPEHRNYCQWDQMNPNEKQKHREDMADIYIATAEAYNHSAVFVHENPCKHDEIIRILETIRDRTGNKYFLMIHGDATFEIPDGTQLADFSYRMADDPESLRAEASIKTKKALRWAEKL